MFDILSSVVFEKNGCILYLIKLRNIKRVFTSEGKLLLCMDTVALVVLIVGHNDHPLQAIHHLIVDILQILSPYLKVILKIIKINDY